MEKSLPLKFFFFNFSVRYVMLFLELYEFLIYLIKITNSVRLVSMPVSPHNSDILVLVLFWL